MKIGDPTYRGAQVHLPLEIVRLITDHVASGHGDAAQTSLWACCLVSKTWYAASVAQLYNYPLLSSRNFDLFVRTICPTQRSRRSRVGLENMIKNLDMSRLAYDSSNSLTARLIFRTKLSLERFTSPAVTFSIASLAPLSKCVNLRQLDLSTDYYSISVIDLLSAIAELKHLTSLSLPKGFHILQDIHSVQNLRWPENLARLRASDVMCFRSVEWDLLIESWPQTLKTVTFPDCPHFTGADVFLHCEKQAEHVQRLKLTESRGLGEDSYNLFDILHVFPALQELIVPADVARRTLNESPVETEEPATRDSPLEILRITPTCHPKWYLDSQGRVNARTDFQSFSRLAVLPRLRRLEMPDSLTTYDGEGDQQTLFEELSRRIEDRADRDQRASAGIFLVDDSEVAEL
ncbi:uncharacterized protein Z520_10632 [Fonsecaea multimorphosa CBS 102226]|uniref:F-box domain-containing protein n=1 Tax=Fonsecaea multimorphosa CBS 102226 TaxID=1442371 RepID=A0A0D2I968_9EURO|nr:uncharacterized protein Z520_10632 [Fonsecaea multimorphosa CBS 102226]KIX93726.1 hypothetical protein Z520_10632 [Fonsecaea multimorphosa CBS 102226]OAL19834.1 hypothetical protein AYO22_09361 [Fonsecaea multimorphosa]